MPAPETVVLTLDREPSSTMTARATLDDDEVRRTHVFLAVSGALALVGCAAAFLFDGDPGWRIAFTVSVVVMLLGYLALWFQTRDLRNYNAGVAVTVITVCNLAGVSASVYFGIFSPAPMILMLPIAFIGLSSSARGAWTAYSVAAGSVGIPMVLASIGLFEDPGLVRADRIGTFGAVTYTLLVQAVYAACFVHARASRRATLHAVEGMERVMLQVQARDALLEEANQRLDEALLGGSQGPLTGSDLGGWRLAALLGRGAMGDVYAAIRREDGLHGAVKVLNPVTASDPEAIALMKREVELLKTLDTPHVVRVFEAGVGDLPWMAMERLSGEDLGAVLRRRRKLPVAELLEMLNQIADGLDAAHQARILHRDLKPSNVFLTDAPGSQWKILDFGVAKRLGQDLTLTRGMLLGTPGYIPPEQLERDGLVDERGDIWALGVIAYRALTGTRPFGGSGQALLLSVLRDQPEAPSQWVDGLPAEVDEVLRVALAKDPTERYASAHAFANALEAAFAGHIEPALRSQARRLIDAGPWGSEGR